MENLAELMDDVYMLGTPVFNPEDLWQLLLHFVFNFIVTGVLIHCFYYPKSKRRDYYFTFALISVSVFFLICLLGSVKLKLGFALGIFAIFGIIRYRTESVPIREMTYLFTLTAISVINALSIQISYAEIVITNIIFLLVTWLLESERWLKHTSSKLIMYDRIQLIIPEKRAELLADLKLRTGLEIQKIEIGHIDFLKDCALIKVYYDAGTCEINSIDHMTRFPKEGE